MNIALKPKDYKSAIKPIWCPGCGHFAALAAITKALAHLQKAPEDTALISGIGCSSRIPAYTNTYGFHGIHGRALPLAMGLKASRPELTVLVAGGDGDGFSIGGNHFMHACRRNMDMTYIVMDNEVYGMTKGQASPTTPPDWLDSKLTPHGTQVRPFNPAAIALASGATFVSRGFSGQPNEIVRQIVAAIEHPGFGFVQILSPCQTFCPEQKHWKEIVRPFDEQEVSPHDYAQAVSRVHHDDGFSTGIIYQDPQSRPWQPTAVEPTTVDMLEQEFCL